MFSSCLFLTETVINLQDEEGFTPLMWAAAHGQIAVVEFLLQNVRTDVALKSHFFIISLHQIMNSLLTDWLSLCIHFRRVPTPTSWPRGERARCPWPAVKATRISWRCSLTVEWMSMNMTGWVTAPNCPPHQFVQVNCWYWIVLSISERRSSFAVRRPRQPRPLCWNFTRWGKKLFLKSNTCDQMYPPVLRFPKG